MKLDQNKTLYDYNGLWIGEIYNILYSDFYINTKHILVINY